MNKKSDNSLKTSVRIDEKVNQDFDKMSDESHKTTTDLLNEALLLYRDVYYCNKKATFLNDNLLATMQGMVDSMERRLNSKTNQVLSELAIQESIIAQMLAYSLDLKGDDIAEMRKKALDFLKVNQRLWRLDEMIED